MRKCKIALHAEDSVYVKMDLTDEQMEFLKKVAHLIKINSDGDYQPTMEIEEIK